MTQPCAASALLLTLVLAACALTPPPQVAAVPQPVETEPPPPPITPPPVAGAARACPTPEIAAEIIRSSRGAYYSTGHPCACPDDTTRRWPERGQHVSLHEGRRIKKLYARRDQGRHRQLSPRNQEWETMRTIIIAAAVLFSASSAFASPGHGGPGFRGPDGSGVEAITSARSAGPRRRPIARLKLSVAARPRRPNTSPGSARR